MSYISCQEDDNKRLDDVQNSKASNGYTSVPPKIPDVDVLREEILLLKGKVEKQRKDINRLKQLLKDARQQRLRTEEKLRGKEFLRQNPPKNKGSKSEQKSNERKSIAKLDKKLALWKQKELTKQSQKPLKKEDVVEIRTPKNNKSRYGTARSRKWPLYNTGFRL